MEIKANIIEGIYFRIAGEAGQTNGLPFHVLINLFEHLQELIRLLAKYDLEVEGAPHLDQFEIELFDYRPGSAVPAIRIRRLPYVGNLYGEDEKQKLSVASKFDKLLQLADAQEYDQFFPDDMLPEVREEIAEEMYGLTLSADNSPITVVKPVKDAKDNFVPIYRIQKFTKEQSDKLLRPKRVRAKANEPVEMLGLIQKVGKRKRIIDLYENSDTVLSIAPQEIVLDHKKYVLHSPLHCSVVKEDGIYVVQNDMLDLYASGETVSLAEHDFYLEFDAAYLLMQDLRDEELSPRLQRAKTMMNSYIKEIVIE